MAIGSNIRELRIKKGFTQKDLADKLHVTYQAVSRWENNDVEPSIDTLKELTNVLECSLDQLFGNVPVIEEENNVEEVKEENDTEEPKENDAIEEPVIEEPKVVEKIIVQEAKPVLGVCEKCKKIIRDTDDFFQYEEVKRHGRHSTVQKVLNCKKCNYERLKKIAEIKEKQKLDNISNCKKRRILSFVISGIVAAILIGIAISCVIGTPAWDSFALWLTLGILGFTFVSCLILNNTFIRDLWVTISCWGIVKMPGIIFELSWDGLKFLILAKILLSIISVLIGLLASALATVVAMPLSLFAYPFALKRNFKGIIDTDF